METEKPENNAMPAIDALAKELDIKPGEHSETVTGEQEPARKSLSDFIPTAVLLGFIITVLWKIVQKVSETARQVELSKGEIETLANGWGPVMDDYMPSVPDGNWSNALLATGVVAGPKYFEAKAKMKKNEKQKKAGNSQPGQQSETVKPVANKQDEKPALKPASSRKK